MSFLNVKQRELLLQFSNRGGRFGSFVSPHNANLEWQTLTKAEVSLGLGWYGPRQSHIVRSSGSFYSRGGALAHRVNPSSKTITIPGMAKRVSLLSSIPIPPPIYATSLLRFHSSPCPGPFLAMLASRPSREIYSNSNSSTTSRP